MKKQRGLEVGCFCFPFNGYILKKVAHLLKAMGVRDVSLISRIFLLFLTVFEFFKQIKRTILQEVTTATSSAIASSPTAFNRIEPPNLEGIIFGDTVDGVRSDGLVQVFLNDLLG